MADFTITVSNAFNVFGLEPSTKWNAFNWGQSWGYGVETTICEIIKGISESLSVASANELSAGFNIDIADSFSVNSEPVEETLQDGRGYYYVFTKPAIDAEDRNLSSFTAQTRTTTTWSEPSTSTTSWSEE